MYVERLSTSAHITAPPPWSARLPAAAFRLPPAPARNGPAVKPEDQAATGDLELCLFWLLHPRALSARGQDATGAGAGSGPARAGGGGGRGLGRRCRVFGCPVDSRRRRASCVSILSIKNTWCSDWCNFLEGWWCTSDSSGSLSVQVTGHVRDVLYFWLDPWTIVVVQLLLISTPNF